MPSAIISSVSSFGDWVASGVAGGLGAIGISEGTAAISGAVAGAVAEGAVYGAVIGASAAAISGDDIFRGALTGAAIGGVAGGVVEGAGLATGTLSADSPFSLAGAGEFNATPNQVDALSAGRGPVNVAEADRIAAATPKPTPAPSPPPSSAMDPTTRGLMYSGLGQGFFGGLGAVGVEAMKKDTAEEVAETQAEQEIETAKAKQALNVPGQFQAQVANIKLPDWWSRYLNPQIAPKTGLLATATRGQ